MKKNISGLLTVLMLLSCVSCGNNNNIEEYSFANAGFETGLLTNWAATGDAFTDNNVTIADSSKDKIHVVGNFYLNGESSGNSATGTLQSTSFKLNGNGKIGFMIGAGKNQSSVYVSLHLEKTNEEIARVSNKFFNSENPNNRMYRIILDASNYIGENVYLNIVDNDNQNDGYNYIMVDDFIISYLGDEDDGSLVSDARKYTEANKNSVGNEYRHTYHLMPTIGWMNDPNGFTYYDGYYHLFYQHNPYSSNWDTMHWGHAISKDLIVWEDAGVALAPDKSYDKLGVYSGGAIEKDGTLNLLYTSVGDGGVQQQALATSYDGYNFTKRANNPVISSSQRLNSRITDFRDPYLFEKDGVFYVLVGGKLEGEGGQLILYSSHDLMSWKTIGSIYSSTLTRSGMFECPNLAFFDDKEVIITSPQSIRDSDISNYQNIHSVTYQIGNIDFENGTFTNDYGQDFMEEFDKGFDFYATQVISDENRVIMLAWMNMWSRSYPTAIDQWAGEITLPRELELIDGHIYQKPIREIEKYYQNETILSDINANNENIKLDFSGNTLHLKAEIDVSNLNGGQSGFKLFKGSEEETSIYYDDSLGMVVFDRKNSGIEIDSFDDDSELNVRYASVDPIDGVIKLEFFLDVSSIEVFINDGYYTMSGLVYPSSGSEGVQFFASNGSATLKSLIKHDVIVGAQ